MNHRCIKLVNSFFFFFVHAVIAQNTLPYSSEFYYYLKQQHLPLEELTYLNTLGSCHNVSCSDTIFLSKALCYYELADNAACSQMTDSIVSLSSFRDRNLQENYLSLLFQQKKFTALDKTLSAADTNLSFNRRSKIFLQILKRQELTVNAVDTGVMRQYPMEGILNRYKHQPHRSPLVAGLLSAAIPGLGKLYAGYKYQAISAFATNFFFAAQTVEAMIRSGFKSVHFVYTSSIFSVYYIGNIVGSVIAAKKKKRDHLNQLDDEIINYYSSHLGANAN